MFYNFNPLMFLVGGALLLALSLAPAMPVQAQAAPHFPQTGFTVDNDAIWSYFQSRGGVDTFGYPISRTFLFQGFSVQVFQRHVLQAFDQQARPLNLLDPGLLPITHYGGLTFPTYDETLAEAAPAPGTPDYSQAVQQFLNANVPNVWEDASVGFLSYFESAAPAGTPGDATLVALEVWGFPTSRPMRDPNNANFIYQRFQRGIIHHDATQGVTRGILLGEAFRSVLVGQNLSSPLRDELAGSPLLNLYAPDQPNWMAHTAPDLQPPITRENTDLTEAFDAAPGDGAFESVDVYLIAMGTGGDVGCNDSVVAVQRPLDEPTTMPLTAAIRELLAIEQRSYGESGLYNALFNSDLSIQNISLDDRGRAVVRLQGEMSIGGVCDPPRVEAQLEQTALQFDTVDSVTVFINDAPVELIGAPGPAVAIWPSSGPPGTEVEVMAINFPPTTPVTLSVAQEAAEPAHREVLHTDARGTLRTRATIPSSARPGGSWVVMVTTEEPGIQVTSNSFAVRE